MVRKQGELKKEFDEQCELLESACSMFDEGKSWAAKLMAGAAYVLLRDGGKQNKSVLTQMGLKSGMVFLATGKKHPRDPLERAAFMPLVGLRFEDGRTPYYIPQYARHPEYHRWLKFDEWWTRDVIFGLRDKKDPRRERNILTRKRVIHTLRDQDGHGHFDEKITDDDYHALKHEEIWVSVSPDGQRVSLGNLERVTMRQVAFELLESIRRSKL